MQKDACICVLAVGAPKEPRCRGLTVEVEINLDGRVNSGLYLLRKGHIFYFVVFSFSYVQRTASAILK